MYSAIRTLLPLLAISAVTLGGCRGPSPFGRFVQVTKDTTDELPNIDAPQQRLATAKPRAEGAETPKIRDQSPHVTRTVSTRSGSDSSATSNSVPERRTLSDLGSLDPEPDSTTRPSTPPAQSAMNSSQRTSNKQELSDEQIQDIMTGLGNMRPDLRQALQQVMLDSTQKATPTAQPNGIDIAANLDHLPELPESTNRVSDTPPTRIAYQPNTSPSSNRDTQPANPHVAEPDSQLVATEVESPTPTVATAANTVSDSEVKPASASNVSGSPSMVTRAAVDSSLSIDVDPNTLTNQLSDQVLYTSLIQRLAEPVAGESEAQRASRLTKLRYLTVLSGDPDRAVEPIDGLPRAEQEYLRYQLLGLWSLIDPQGHPVASRRFTAALPHIREAGKFAAAATDSLEVRSLAFCTEIESYGQIKTFSGNRFDSGQQVILYCEVENFTVANQENGFETHLQGSYDIFNASNEKVVSQLLPADQQVSANYLRDYFIAYQMHLPAQLSPGTYRMQLTMEDVAGKKYGQASIPFEIAE